MFEDLGIVYLIEHAQQFWYEIEDIVHIRPDITLSTLDATLKRFVSFCARYHEQYLQSPLQIEHACNLLIDSELFNFHSERMCEQLLEDARTNTDPHCQLILFNVLITYGRREPNFLRSHKKWKPLIPLFMDYVLVEIDPDVEDTYMGSTSAPGPTWSKAAGTVPIEAKLRTLSVRLLYEVCRVQKLTISDLRIFNDSFLDFLFDLVEDTRNLQDDTFNYAVIKLIVALNEQFMVATMPSQARAVDVTKPLPSPNLPGVTDAKPPEARNRVFRVLMRRLNLSQTFGENMIFMLNRASNRSMEDRCMQVLVLKLLYLLFTTPGTTEYFYTNDLCVLVDVFLRELLDLDEESESLRHTFLRVLYPLLTKTQLKTYPYKRPQVVRALECLLENPEIRDIDPTTKRLAERCLSGDWCVQFTSASPAKRGTPGAPVLSATGSDTDTAAANTADSRAPERRPSHRRAPSTRRNLKTSRSAEQLSAAAKSAAAKPATHAHRAMDALRRHANESTGSLPMPTPMISAVPPPMLATRKQRSDSADIIESTVGLESRGTRRFMDGPSGVDAPIPTASPIMGELTQTVDAVLSLHDGLPLSPPSPHLSDIISAPPSPLLSDNGRGPPPPPKPRRRPAPPAPPKQRRKPPAPPSKLGVNGIGSSTSQHALMQTRA